MEERLRCPKSECKGALMEKLPEDDFHIDRCPSCGGVFLDGPKRDGGPDELTALVAHVGIKREFRPRREIAEEYFAGMANTPYASHVPSHQGGQHRRDDGPAYSYANQGGHHGQGGHQPRKKKGGFLKTLLESIGEE